MNKRNVLKKIKNIVTVVIAKLYGHTAHTERPSAPASLKGSVTVEAACALPLFIAAVMSAVLAVWLHFADSGVSDALVSAAFTANAAGSGTEAVLSKAELDKGIYEEREQEPFFKRNTDGCVTFFLPHGDGLVTISADYRASIGGAFFGGRGVLRAQSVTTRLFTGYEPGSAGGTESGYEYIRVLMTEYGSVYHTHADCTYLTRHPERISYEDLDDARNADGGRYHRCRYCTHGKLTAGDSVWVTPQGDSYHTDPACRSIKPVYKEVLIKDDGSIRCCSRCAGR